MTSKSVLSSEHPYPTDERAIVELELRRARAAMQNTVADLKTRLADQAAPDKLVGAHPWVSLGIAAVTGFAAASAVVPAKGERLRDKLSRTAEHFTSPPKEAATEQTQQAQAAPAGKFGWLFDLATTAVTQYLTIMAQQQAAASAAAAQQAAASAANQAPTETAA